MTAAETRAFNAGMNALLDIAAAEALRISKEGKRPLLEAFAVAALGELAEAGRALLLPVEPVGATPCRG